MRAAGRRLSRAQAILIVRGCELLKPVVRWTPHRKRDLVRGIADGALTAAQAMAAHKISADELRLWQDLLGVRSDVLDLRVTKIRQRPFRPAVPPAPSFEKAIKAA